MRSVTRWVTLGLGALALAGSARAQVPAPYHPLPEDVSVRYGDSSSFKRINPVTGDYNTQTERLLRTSVRYAVAAPAVYLAASKLPSCAAALQTSRALIARTFNDFSVRKSVEVLDGRRAWAFGPQYDVGTPLAVLKGFRHCFLARARQNGKADIPENVLRILDLSIENGKIVRGNPNVNPMPMIAPPCRADGTCASGVKACTTDLDCKPDRLRLNAGMLTGAPVIRQPLTDEQVAKLHEIHMCHYLSGESNKNHTPPPPCSTKQLHRELEGMARDAREQTLFTIPDFPTSVDRTRPEAEIGQLFDIADKAHMEWMDAVLALDQVQAWRKGLDHQRAHMFLTVNWPSDFRLRTICNWTTIPYCPSEPFPPPQ